MGSGRKRRRLHTAEERSHREDGPVSKPPPGNRAVARTTVSPRELVGLRLYDFEALSATEDLVADFLRLGGDCECHNIFSVICALFAYYYILDIMYASTVENVMLFLDTHVLCVEKRKITPAVQRRIN